MAIKRMRKELKAFQDEPPKNCTLAYEIGEIGDPTHWELCLQGPVDTPYSGGVFLLNVDLPKDYPFKPPIINFRTPIYHPNINQDGKIQLKVLKEQWHPTLTISKCIEYLTILMANPYQEEFLDKEISNLYKSDRNQFIINVTEFTNKYAM